MTFAQTRTGSLVGLATAILTLAGCGVFGDGMSDYERQQNSKKTSTETLMTKGAKFEKRQYPQGEAWAADLSGMQITDETFTLLKKTGYITEINLSGSSITDAQLAKLDDVNLTGLVLKLDLSNTGITDAGLAEMKNFTFLREVNLTGTKATSAGVEALKKNREANTGIRVKAITIIQ